MEAVHADWKEYLNLLICEESHLKYMEDYHQVPGPQSLIAGSIQCLLGSLVASVPFPPGASQDCLRGPHTAHTCDARTNVPRACLALIRLAWGPGRCGAQE